MGLIVNVYRTGERDFSLGGISSKVDEVTVVNLDGPFKPNPDRPAFLLIQNPAGKQYGKILVPAVAGDGTDEWVPLNIAGTSRQFGGNIADSHDARWSEATKHGDKIVGHPVRIHDRFEG